MGSAHARQSPQPNLSNPHVVLTPQTIKMAGSARKHSVVIKDRLRLSGPSVRGIFEAKSAEKMSLRQLRGSSRLTGAPGLPQLDGYCPTARITCRWRASHSVVRDETGRSAGVKSDKLQPQGTQGHTRRGGRHLDMGCYRRPSEWR